MLSFCQNRASLKKTMSKIFLWSFIFRANKTLETYVCFEIIPAKQDKKYQQVQYIFFSCNGSFPFIFFSGIKPEEETARRLWEEGMRPVAIAA